MNWILVLAMSAALLPGAPATTPTQTANPKNDSELQQNIRARFARSKISADNFQVKVQGGIATIEGTTNIIQHKATATRLARLAGAKEVVNKIKISDAARQKAAAQLSRKK